MTEEYDVIIIGGGPAGLTAGLYASRSRLSTLLVEKGLIGGQIINAERVENYPGFPNGISGFEIVDLMHQQATKYGLRTLMAEVGSIKLQKERKIIKTNNGKFVTKVVIIAGGSKWQKMNIPGEDKYAGKGVSYCATCDAAFFKDLPVAVVGGGDSAITEALHLAKFATKVSVIHRRDQLRATKILQEKAFTEPKIEFLWDSTVTEIIGQNNVQRLKLHQVKTDEESTLNISGIFISIGLSPNTDYLKDILPLDDSGHIITNNHLETGTIGIYAAGDIRRDSARQAITAAGDGATAAIYAENYLI